MKHIPPAWLVVAMSGIASIAPTATASTTTGDRQAFDVRDLKLAADSYFSDTGRYPLTDESGTWFQKLVAANYIWPEDLECGTPSGAPLPLDLFGRPLVYEVPDPSMPGSAIVRCIGKDGVDNLGAGDDLDSRYGPNLGYWNKRNWPQFYTWAIGGWMVAFASGFMVWVLQRRRMPAVVITLLVGGVIVGVMTAIRFDAGYMRTSATRLPHWGNLVSLWSCAAIPFASIVGVILFVRSRRRKPHRIREMLCPKCAYPIGGSDVCTECGTLLAWRDETGRRTTIL